MKKLIMFTKASVFQTEKTSYVTPQQKCHQHSVYFTLVSYLFLLFLWGNRSSCETVGLALLG